MDEQKKMGLKRKPKHIETSIDPDDDEPIGALLKKKCRRSSKKIKLVEKMVVEDDAFGGMDDTLANFRKKIKGPKKNVGSITATVKELRCHMAETSHLSLNEFVKDSELDLDGISMVQKRCPESIEGGSSVDVSLIERLKVKTTEKIKRSKTNADTKIAGNSMSNDSFHLNTSGINGALKLEKEHALESEGEELDDSLSTFLKKMQSEKSRSASRLKRGKENQVSDDGPKLNPETLESESTLAEKFIVPDEDIYAAPGQGSVKSTFICQSVEDRFPEVVNCTLGSPTDLNKEIFMDGLSGEVITASITMFESSPSSLKTCDVKIPEIKDGKINCDVVGNRSSRDDICDNLKLHIRLDSNMDPDHSAKIQKKLPSGDYDGPVKFLDNRCSEQAEVAAFCSQEVDNRGLEPKSLSVSSSENLTCEVVPRMANDVPDKVDIETEHVSRPSRVLSECACPPNSDYPSEDEEVNGTSNSSNMLEHQGMCVEDKVLLDDPETKEKNLSIGQRAVRNSKKQRHVDMAYEGDIDWEVLMQAPEFSVSQNDVTEKLDSSSVSLHAGNGKAAAVAAGLKARAAAPLEKIKFKEVLKRKGGLQEYLECRNHILSVWNKDVSHILLPVDFGVPESPLVGESKRTSLIRDIFNFLDQYGYINFGVSSGKESTENCTKPDVKLLTEEKFRDNSALPVTDSEDVNSFTLENQISENFTREKDGDAISEGNMAGKVVEDNGLIILNALESSAPCVPEGGSLDDNQGINFLDPVPLEEAAGSEDLCSIPSCKDENGNAITAVQPDFLTPGHAVCGRLPYSMDCAFSHTLYDSEPRKNIIVVGAGPAGLTAARHLQRHGFVVTVLEARGRVGGRVFTDRSSLSVPVDLGASIITGVEADVATERRPDPSSLICAQLGLELTVLNSECPLYDTVTGQKVPADLDEALEAEYNSLLDEMELLVSEKGEHAMKMSLEEGLEYGLKRRHMAHSGRDDVEALPVKSRDTYMASETEGLSPLERRVMDWHFAHLEYGCAALLEEVSLPNWNQDDVYGGFGGAHCMIKGGYSAVIESLAEGVCVHLDHVVTDISYGTKDCETNNELRKNVIVSTSNGKEFSAAAVLVTVPLGCLKAESIKFTPPLPEWKYLSIKRLGFGVLNKVVLEFPEVFWDDTIDYFGATAEDRDQRGRCFMFWNVMKTVGAPVLIALVVGKAAIDGENICSSDNVSHALLVLRKLFGEDKVSDPVAAVVTDWGRDPYSLGAYSHVAVGSSGEDYDILGRPVGNCLFFAGEATCKEHPDTVGGAMMSGLREAVRIIDIMNTGTDFIAEVEAMEAARRHSDIERSEVKDIVRRLDAMEFSSALYKKSLDRLRISSWGSILKDMFFSAKTNAGRLHLAKELLNLPVGFLKTFASTKEGLGTLNAWILDSMGKNGTQLLRHCVRLLVLVSNDLAAVRLSGVGKTVKQKVCVHTSRDIRAIAFQLVRVWVDLFRKEKASKGGIKLLRPSNSLDSKSKSPLESKGSLKVVDEPKSEAHHSNSHGSLGWKEDNYEIPMSEEEKAACTAAEAARAAAVAAAKALACSSSRHISSRQPPKILSFHKFAMRGQHTHIDEPYTRNIWSGVAVGRQDCLSEIDSRNCRVRDWSVDFSATGVNPESSRIPIDNPSQASHSNEVAANHYSNIREQSGESVVVGGSLLTRAWVDSAGSVGIKDYSAIERWQCQAAAASSGFSHESMQLMDDEVSNMSSRKYESRVNESSVSRVTLNNVPKGSQPRGAERLKKAVVDYVASLLMPLYNAKKIDKDGYKSIMKKAATKVMEQTTDAEKAMAISEFLDFKRKNKIRAFVDLLIERHKALKPDTKSGSSEKE